MKIVDVLGARCFKDGERIIAQVTYRTRRDWLPAHRQFERTKRVELALPQGDTAECFYIVESGQVRIMIKSKVSLMSVHIALLAS